MKNILAAGEVLLDVFPSGAVIGGAPCNFAWYCHQFGLNETVVSAVGDDDNGKRILRELSAAGLNISLIKTLKDKPTGTVQVTLDAHSVPSYEIIKDVAWDNIPFDAGVAAAAAAADVICFGSLAQRSTVSKNTIQQILDTAKPGALKIFDINLRQKFYSKELLEICLKKINILKISDEELPLVSALFGYGENAPRSFLEDFNLDIVLITKGSDGSSIFTKDTEYISPGVKPACMQDTVGAGDSFTAAFCAGLLKGMKFEEIGMRANAVASYICSQKGAMVKLPKDLVF